MPKNEPSIWTCLIWKYLLPNYFPGYYQITNSFLLRKSDSPICETQIPRMDDWGIYLVKF